MDGRRPSGDNASDPGELLRSVLEKIVFFECKVAQLEAELAAARQIAERARADAAASRDRETGLAQELAAARSAQGAATSREADLADRVELLERERERLLGGLVERARVAGAPAAEGDAPADADESDLAGFIAELRAEIETLRAWKAAAEARGVAPAPAPPVVAPRPAPVTVPELAGDFRAAGRTGLSLAEVTALAGLPPARADRILHERAMADLAAAEPSGRKRAARQLAALGARTAAPLLAAALGRESDAEVKVTLLEALGRLQEPFAAGLAARQLDDAHPEVRAAALEALAAVAQEAALPHLTRRLGDPSAMVRRRAAVLLGFARGEEAEAALAGALGDADPSVARAAAAALSGRAGDGSRLALERYQRAARPPLRSPAPATAPAPAPATVRAVAPAQAAAPARARAAVAVLEAPAVVPAGGGALDGTLLLELRGALRGRTTEELVQVCGAPSARIDAALEVLAGRGAVTRRGPRWCMA